MATVRTDLPDQATLDGWNTLSDVYQHYGKGCDDAKAVIEEMGGDADDGIAVIATADPEAILEAVTDWAVANKVKPLRLSRVGLVLNAMRVAKGREITQLTPTKVKIPELPAIATSQPHASDQRGSAGAQGARRRRAQPHRPVRAGRAAGLGRGLDAVSEMGLVHAAAPT